MTVGPVSQGNFSIERHIDGRLKITCPPVFIVPPDDAIKIAAAILKAAGVETVFAEPGQTVVRPPAPKVVRGLTGVKL